METTTSTALANSVQFVTHAPRVFVVLISTVPSPPIRAEPLNICPNHSMWTMRSHWCGVQRGSACRRRAVTSSLNVLYLQ